MKKHMSNKAFRAITIPIASVLSLAAIAVTVAGAVIPGTLNTFLGKGDLVIKKAEGQENFDTNYYKKDVDDQTKTRENGFALANQIQDEGTVLLKNNGVLPLAKKSSVMPFGYRYLTPIYGQMTSGGSGKWVDGKQITPESGLSDFTILNDAVDKMKASDVVSVKEADGTSSTGASSALGGDNALYEYDAKNIYSSLLPNRQAVALVFIARPGQEGTDLKADGYQDGTKHQLCLSQNEKETIRAAKNTCGKVVLILECSTSMELGEVMEGKLEVDAILNIGHVGERGFSQLGALLSGDVNPSGRTVEIWTGDFTKDPSYANFGDYYYTNATCTSYGFGTFPHVDENGNQYRSYIEYQEGVYMGYRYYETMDAVNDSFVYGTLDGKGAIREEGAVTYPFGYGLSYTTFSQEITSFEEKDGNIEVSVKITNTGDVAGKDVAQVYYTSPYTEYDRQHGIEKPSTVLAAFGKSNVIEPKASDTVTLSFAIEDMASYSYDHDNSDGSKGCYLLEEGDYQVELKNNSHDLIDSRTYHVSRENVYQGQNLRKSDRDAQSALDENGNVLDYPAKAELDSSIRSYTPVNNLFQDETDYMKRQSKILSRTDFKPLSLAPKTKAADETTLALAANDKNIFDVDHDLELGNVEGSKVYASQKPTYSGEKVLSLIDLRGKDYYDPSYETFLDQVDWSSKEAQTFIQGLSGCAYNTPSLVSLGVPSSRVEDGVNGIKSRGSDNGYDMTKTTTFGMMPLVASTWNVDLAEKLGVAIGQDGLLDNCQGLYAPAINLHRSPFGGRNFEYFSEDPLLSGKLAASEVSGAASQGLYTTLKHFALNDQETNRSYQLSIWADEQTMREIYFKPFEIAIKEAKTSIRYIADEKGTIKNKVIRAASGVMSSQANIGMVPGHANYPLLTSLLRDEWGFQGMVSTDYWFWADFSNPTNGNRLRDACFRAGSDAYLCMAIPSMVSTNDNTSATALSTFRRCLKNICYTLVNSNAMNGYSTGTIISYKMSPWKVALIWIDIAVGVLDVAVVLWIVFRARDEKKNPDHYRNKKREALKKD